MAYAKLLVRDKVGEFFQHPEAHTEFQTYLREQVAYLKSRLVLNAALSRKEVLEAKPSVIRDHTHPVDWLALHVKVDFPEGPQMPRLSLLLDDPEEAKLLVEAITKAYFDEVVNKEKEERYKLLEKLTTASKTREEKLKTLKSAIKELGKNIGALDPRSAAIRLELAILDLREAHKDLRDTNRDLQRLQFEEAQGKQEGAGAAKVPEFLVEEHLNKDPKISELKAKVAKAKAELEEMRCKVVNANDPIVKRLEEHLTLQQKQLESFRQELRPEAEKFLREWNALQNLHADPIRRQREISRLQEQKKNLEEAVASLTKQAGELKEGGLNLDDYREDRELEAKIASYLAELREKLTIDLDTPPRVRILEPAAIEHVEEVPRKIKFAGLAAAAALALTLLGVGFFEFRLHRVDSPESVVRTLGVNLVGTVPACPLRNGQLAGGDANAVYWQHVLTDSIDAARTMLVHRARGNGPSAVMITSAVSGEGKTSLASHLAISMVRAGYKTLLIDCDFRNPDLHRLFDQPLEPGFCELLRDECTLADVQRPSSVTGLTLISAGRLDPTALRLLARSRGEDIFNQLRGEFEFIIVDSSPLLPVADGLLVAQLVDGALLSLLCDVSRLPRVYEACSRLTSLGVTVLGAVVNGTVDNFSDYDKRYIYTSHG
jgi:capsular exopolysaccharide synthesis family protein